LIVALCVHLLGLKRIDSKWLFVLVLTFGLGIANDKSRAQAFVGKGGEVVDFLDHDSKDVEQLFPVEVSGLPSQMDTNFGLERACLTLIHPRIQDLKIELRSPSGQTVWLTNRNGGRDANYAGTCFESGAAKGLLNENRAPFTGAFIPDGRLEFINDGTNPNGIWFLVVHDLAPELKGELMEWVLTFSNKPARELPHTCDVGYEAVCACPPGKLPSDSCWLLPDLIISEKTSMMQWEEYPPGDELFAGELRVAVATANIGYGPMETHGTGVWRMLSQPKLPPQVLASGERPALGPNGEQPHQDLVQVLYRLTPNGLDTVHRLAGTNYFDEKPGHVHYHADGWVDFSLREIPKALRLKPMDPNYQDPRKWKVVGQGEKVSYCLFDTGLCTDSNGQCTTEDERMRMVWGRSNLTNYGFGRFTDCQSNLQGISVGAYDYYGFAFEGQGIKLGKKVKNGTYMLVIEVDPDNRYLESNETNNLIAFPVTLKHRGR